MMLRMNPKTILTTLLAALALLVALPHAAAAQDAPAETATPAARQGDGKLQLEWDRMKKPHRKVTAKLRRSGAIQALVDAVNELLVLPRDIPIVFTDRTTIGPAYIPDAGKIKGNGNVIVFPGWFLKLEHEELRKQLRGVKGLTTADAVAYANQFVIAHEIGHAIVNQLKLPITGKEEDAVDGFAAYLLTEDKRFGPLAPISAAALFDALSHPGSELDESDWADEHSLPQQRVYQFLCWVYGSDAKRFKDLVGRDLLPRKRAVRCKSEYRQLRSSWSRLLEPHLKDAASRD
jgi:hypothetical protein